MKTFKFYLKELTEVNPPLDPRSPEYQQKLATNRQKVEADLASRPITAQQKQQQINSEKRGLQSDTVAGREWADKNIDAVQKGTDYATTALGATQVGKPLAAGMQGISSLVDLTQGQYAQSAGRAVGAALTAIPGSEVAKLGSLAAKTAPALKTAAAILDPLKTAVKTGVEAVVKTGVPGKLVGSLANTAAQSFSSGVRDLSTNATAQGIGHIATKVGSKFATDQLAAAAKPVINSGINAVTANIQPTTSRPVLANSNNVGQINRPKL
jgi:hypothetical protein